MEITVCPIAFGPVGRDLRLWLECYRASGSGFPVKVITSDRQIEPFVDGVDLLAVEEGPPWQLHPLNLAGWLKSFASELVGGPALVVDLDVLIATKIDDGIEDLLKVPKEVVAFAKSTGVHYPWYYEGTI